MDEDLDGGLFNIQLSDDDDDDDDNDNDNNNHHDAPQQEKVLERVDRTGQTEAQFQAVKQNYHAKVEDGGISKNINISLPPGANKIHLQELLHAVEELYFFRRFQEAIDFVRDVLDANRNREASGLDRETRDALSLYASKCRQKLGTS